MIVDNNYCNLERLQQSVMRRYDLNQGYYLEVLEEVISGLDCLDFWLCHRNTDKKYRVMRMDDSNFKENYWNERFEEELARISPYLKLLGVRCLDPELYLRTYLGEANKETFHTMDMELNRLLMAYPGIRRLFDTSHIYKEDIIDYKHLSKMFGDPISEDSLPFM